MIDRTRAVPVHAAPGRRAWLGWAVALGLVVAGMPPRAGVPSSGSTRSAFISAVPATDSRATRSYTPAGQARRIASIAW